jgi:hypothetical protein
LPGDPAAWAQPLWALGQQGRLWIESGGPECRLAQVGSLAGIRVGDRVALLQSGRLGLGVLLGRPQSQGAIPGGSSGHLGTGLWIDDRDGTALLRVSHLAGPPDLGPIPAPAPALAAAHGPAQESLPGLRRRWESLARIHDLARPAQSAGPGFDDIAELCGWIRLDEARLRERGRAILADPDLVPCLLETLAEQALPVRVAVGDGAVVQWVDDAFHCYEARQEQVQIQGAGLRLALSRAALDSAWVLIQGQGPGARRQVRLYGEDGRALALIESAARPGQSDCPLWRTLANALVD